MRFLAFMLALSATTAQAAEPAQKPLTEQLNGWFDKAKAYMPSAAMAPLDAGAAVVASDKLVYLKDSNWESVLAPTAAAKPGIDTWMVLVTGGNRTCGGQCGQLDVEFNKSIAVLSAERNPPNFAIIDCESAGIMCSVWLAGPTTLWYILRPQRPLTPADVEVHLPTDIHVVKLNTTTTTAQDIVAIHKDKTYILWSKIVSYWHPFDGELARWGVQRPVGYALWAFNKIPSWGMMVAVSFFTRTFMNGRMQGRNQRGQPAAGAAAAGAR